MMTHRVRIRRRPRSARVSVLTTKERLEALRAAEKPAPQDDRPTPGTDAASDATPTSRAGIP